MIVLGDPLRVLPDLLGLSRQHGRRSSARTSSASRSVSTPWRCSRPRSASSARSPPRSSTRSARCWSCSIRCGSWSLATGAELPPFAARPAARRLDRPARRPSRPRAGLAMGLGTASRPRRCDRGDRAAGRLCDQRLDRDRPGRGRAAPAVRPVSRDARAGPAPALAVSDRAGHDRRARPGPQPGDRLPRGGPLAVGQPGMGGEPRPPSGDPVEDEGLLLTGDGRYVELAATLQFSIDRDRSRMRRADSSSASPTAKAPWAAGRVGGARGRRPPGCSTC